MAKYYEELPFYDKLKNKIHAYYQTIWREKWNSNIDQAEDWLQNFHDVNSELMERERINMLFLLSKFMYFGSNELRQLLISLYRDLFKYPIVSKIRSMHGDTMDLGYLNSEFKIEENSTRFLGVGNPSESGVHMLYYFRQECNLAKDLFIDKSEIFNQKKVTDKIDDGTERTYLVSEIGNVAIRRYIFIDDFCGSGNQAETYLKDLVQSIKFYDPTIEVNYLMLFGTELGIENVRALGIFNRVETVYTIDETFKTFSENSRYFKIIPDESIDKKFSEDTASKYGSRLFRPSLGHGDCQLLLGLFHNTPDNSLPIFWSDYMLWKPIFKRYHKKYNL